MDNNISPLVAKSLTEAGHDATHVSEYGMQAASDRTYSNGRRQKAECSSRPIPTSAHYSHYGVPERRPFSSFAAWSVVARRTKRL
ncbi:hypothetical protein SAMN05443668_11038 [Cryptosporangium aurantiacum]|uniref:DUF5615 domain-containing protein n=1 Tax=Cryptosporangium aurantiacum TaxID=134849 RepID=A0A1M7RCZ9_9ACTN|nr:DUF5615 family PIN-like protein [Cryptosporangium aurantiacum]SHN44060.1 hypothetical protein SAMN05443668_11038 [Cryptosporangium aurantiacum]